MTKNSNILGEMAGIAIGVAILGILIGVIAGIFMFKVSVPLGADKMGHHSNGVFSV